MTYKSYILGALAFIAFIITTALVVELSRYKTTQKEAFFLHSQETTRTIKSELENFLKGVQSEADAMGATFGEREYSRDEVEDIIRETSLANPEINGVTVCYEPYAFDAKKKLFCPYYDKVTSEFVYIEESYDYTVIEKKRSGTQGSLKTAPNG